MKKIVNFVSICVLIVSTILVNQSVNGQALTSRTLTIGGNATEELSIYDDYQNRPQDSFRFVAVAVHSQKYNLTLFKSNRTNNESVSGHDIGLVLITGEDIGTVYITNDNADDVNALLVVTYHGANDPIPGGCNEEFPLEISPFLRLYNNLYINRLDFQLAQIGTPETFKPFSCEKTQFLIKYDIYAYYLRENDFSEEEYFRAINLMSNVSDIKESGVLVANTSTTRSYFFSYPRRGIVYNIVASSQKYSSPYVPIVSYECTDFSGCAHHNVMSLTLVVLYGLIGFFICIKGHYWFQTQLVFFGLIVGSFMSYLMMVKYTNLGETELAGYSLIGGILFAGICLMVWKTLSMPVLSLSLSGLSVGFLVVSTVLFTSLGNLELFQNDLNYWLISLCTAILVTLFFLMLSAVVLSVVSTSIVGAYVSVVAIDRFVDGCLSFIVLNVVKRAVVPTAVINAVPFQNKDIILSILWILLSLTGIVLQLYDSRDRARNQFPDPSACSPRGRRPRRGLYDVVDHSASPPETGSVRHRSSRWSPVPTAPPARPLERVVDERSSLLYPNYNIYGPRPATPPPDYNGVTNANRREYASIE